MHQIFRDAYLFENPSPPYQFTRLSLDLKLISEYVTVDYGQTIKGLGDDKFVDDIPQLNLNFN